MNNHQFLGDDNGLGDKPLLTDTASAAKIKKLYLIDLNQATDITDVFSLPSPGVTPVSKAYFLDVVDKLNSAGIDKHLIPSKLEGVAFGQDVMIDNVLKHTLYTAKRQRFLAHSGRSIEASDGPNSWVRVQPEPFLCVAFSDSELPGYITRQLKVDHSAKQVGCASCSILD